MSKPSQHDRIAPGTHSTLHGIDVVAVDQNAPENRSNLAGSAFCGVGDFECPFTGTETCGQTRCAGVIWLTVADYTTHRLTR